MAKQFAEARAEYPRVIELNSGGTVHHAGLGSSYLLEGKLEEAAVRRKPMRPSGRDSPLWLVLAGARNEFRNRMPRLTQLIKSSAETAAYQIAEVYAYRGDKDRAFEWLERARRQRDAGPTRSADDPFLANLPRGPALERVRAHDGPGQRPIETGRPLSA